MKLDELKELFVKDTNSWNHVLKPVSKCKKVALEFEKKDKQIAKMLDCLQLAQRKLSEHYTEKESVELYEINKFLKEINES